MRHTLAAIGFGNNTTGRAYDPKKKPGAKSRVAGRDPTSKNLRKANATQEDLTAKNAKG
jgi:hypothetical protein